ANFLIPSTTLKPPLTSITSVESRESSLTFCTSAPFTSPATEPSQNPSRAFLSASNGFPRSNTNAKNSCSNAKSSKSNRLAATRLGTALGIIGTQFLPSYAKSERTPPKIAVDERPLERGGQFTTSFAPVIKKAAPSVVTISASRIIKQRELRGHPLFDNPLFR